MTTKIKIQDKKDSDKPLFSEMITDDNYGNILQGGVDGFGILQGGMASGKTSIGMVTLFKDKNIPVVLEMSAEMFKVCYHALIGAEQRWENEKAEQN